MPACESDLVAATGVVTHQLPQEGGDVPRLGTTMPVRMYGLGGLQQEVPLPQPGTWVKLRNIAACIISGQLQVRRPNP